MRAGLRVGLIAAIATGLMGAAAGAWASGPATPPSARQGVVSDSRWLPWLGCWELGADAIDYREVDDTGQRVVCVAPRPDGLGVALTTQVDGLVIAEDTVLADGAPQSLTTNDCRGSQTSSWSADGHRLHSAAALDCEGGEQRVVEGLSLLLEDGRWLELQTMSVDAGEHRELLLRFYDRLADHEVQALGFEPLDPGLATRAATARAAAGGPLDVDDVLEASERLPVEIVEAAIVETHSLFDLDRDALFRLADAGVEDDVIDLMVAVSFPDEFVVDSGRGSSAGGGYGSLYYGGYYPAYYSPLCSSYGYRYNAWFTPFGYGRYGAGGCGYAYYGSSLPYYVGSSRGGRVDVGVPAGGSRFGGRVIRGRGYATVSPRLPAESGGALQRGGSILSGQGRGNSGGKAGSGVNPGGFTKGGSSSGSSGASGAKRKAKPRGGG